MKRVLVVDDHVDANIVLCKLIRKLGYEALGAYTGEDALTAMAAALPDLVILDVMMPGMSGLEVLRQLRADPQTAALPVIMYSALADAEFQQHALEKGANDYWVKSGLNFAELGSRLSKYLH